MSAGVFEFIEVEREGDEQFLSRLPGRIHRMVVDLVDDIAEKAGHELREAAPGSIPALVGVEGATVLDPGIVTAVAGVEPDITEESIGTAPFSGPGQLSDPADYPLFVDIGTGVFGPGGRPIAPPQTVMVIPPGRGFKRATYVDTSKGQSIRGQKAQDYSGEAFDQTVGFTALRIAASRLPSGGG